MKLKVNEIIKFKPDYGNGIITRCVLLDNKHVIVFSEHEGDGKYEKIKATNCWTKQECEDSINKGAWVVTQ